MVAHPPITNKARDRKMIVLWFIISLLLLVRRGWRNNFQPAVRTFFDIRIVPLVILAVIPIIWLIRLGINRRILLNDHGPFGIVWIIGIIIGVIGRPPPRPPPAPPRPDPDGPMPIAPMITTTMVASPLITATVIAAATTMIAFTLIATSFNCIPGNSESNNKHQKNKNNTKCIFHFLLLLFRRFIVSPH